MFSNNKMMSSNNKIKSSNNKTKSFVKPFVQGFETIDDPFSTSPEPTKAEEEEEAAKAIANLRSHGVMIVKKKDDLTILQNDLKRIVKILDNTAETAPEYQHVLNQACDCQDLLTETENDLEFLWRKYTSIALGKELLPPMLHDNRLWSVKHTAQIIAFRSFSGIAASFCLPSAVSLINEVFPPGKERNITFAMMGGAQPFGFGIGMVLGGVFTGTIGWQWGFHVAAIINFFMFILAAWQLPPTPVAHKQRIWSRLATDIDWLGLILASGFLAMLSYVISALTGDLTVMKKPINIVLLVSSFVFLLAFVLWVGRQERLGRPALIPNSLWQHKGFSCICFNVFCVWAAFNAFEQYANFFFQDVQGNSPLGTALRFLPAPVSGALANVGVGLLVHRIRGDWIVVLTSIVSALASLLMAIIDPSWSYWRCAFVAQFFNPVGADGMFTVANLLITSMFPPGEQGVAGGVFNTISQTGKSVGMALTLLIAQQVTANSSYADKTSLEALMVGYRAAFWFCVALIVASLVVSVWGLRRIGKVGLKKD
ncbi:hypothetical protein JADG_008192 [Aureobasidium aubasidani]|nr:hypothetical protein JADG_008192 [Aureobasidium pullulans]